MSVNIENFETIFGIKNNIQALRNKVLELAINGKLVEQDANDEPASELIKKIQVERDTLFKEVKIKKQKSLEPIGEDEIPFELPDNWEWVRLDSIVVNSGQKKPDKTFTYIDVASIDNKLGVIREELSILSPEKAPSRARKIVDFGSVIYSTVRPYLLNIAVVDRTFEFEPIVSTAFAVMNPLASCSGKYLYYFLRSQTFVNYVEEQMVGLAYPAINDANLYLGLVALPPINEQHRIVAKIESLMFEIDKLEESLQNKEYIMEQLPKAVVDAIGSCKTGEDLKEQLQFVIENFEIVFQTPESMEELRNVVLQLAIEGKLVPQNTADEPAAELVKKIQIEKDKLVKEGKIKKQQSLSKIEEAEILFEIPENWEWMRLGDVISITSGDGLTKKNMVESGQYPVYGGNGVTGYHNYYNVEEETITIGRVGFYCGCIHLTPANSWVTDNAFITTYPKESINREWLIQTLRTMDLGKNDNATAQPVISQTKIYPLLIPIPSLKEQHLIVQKIESIMSLIDQMEVELKRKADLVEKMAII